MSCSTATVVPARLARVAKIQPGATGLSPLDEQRLRRRLRQAAPSEAWVDAQFVTVHDVAPNGRAITTRAHDVHVFPPGGRRGTAMRWCRCCGRYTPPNCIHLVEHRRRRSGHVVSATLVCDDCRIARDEEAHHELWHTFPHLRPSGTLSFVKLRELYAQRARIDKYFS
jgi:hypothetical protein